MRKYEPIWDAIKQEHKAVITADPRLHSRIKKAVIKEKDRDIAYKLQTREAGSNFKLSIESRGNLIVFRLVDSVLANHL